MYWSAWWWWLPTEATLHLPTICWPIPTRPEQPLQNIRYFKGDKRKIAKDREVERGVISLIPIPLMITSPFLLLIFDPGLQLDVTLLKSLTVKIWNSWKVCKALIKVNISLRAKVSVWVMGAHLIWFNFSPMWPISTPCPAELYWADENSDFHYIQAECALPIFDHHQEDRSHQLKMIWNAKWFVLVIKVFW